VTGKEATGSTVLAVDAGITPLSLHGGEVVALESSGNSATTREVFGQCEEGGQLKFDDRGTISVGLWQAAAANLLAAKAKAPLRLADLPPVLARFAPSFAGWEHFRPAQARPAQTCFVPVTVVNANNNGGYEITAGYTLHRNGTKIGSTGLHSTLTPTQLPSNFSDADRQAALQVDLANTIQSLALQASAALRVTP